MNDVHVCLALLVGVFLVGCNGPRTPPAEPLSNDSRLPISPATDLGSVPDITLRTLSDDRLRLADLQGRVVMIHFWTTWCVPCKQEIPKIAALHDSLRSQGLYTIGISLDSPLMMPGMTKPENTVRQLAQEMGVTYPTVFGSEKLAEIFGGVPRLPTIYIIDPKGTIVERITGSVNFEEVRPRLVKLLDGAYSPER